jgi:hypothetical protein
VPNDEEVQQAVCDEHASPAAELSADEQSRQAQHGQADKHAQHLERFLKRDRLVLPIRPGALDVSTLGFNLRKAAMVALDSAMAGL